MEIKDHTTWNTKDLKKLFVRVSKEENYFPKIIEVKYQRGNFLGRAELNGSLVIIYLPHKRYFLEWENGKYRQKEKVAVIIENEELIELAKTYVHELNHNKGLTHKDMVKDSELKVDYIKKFKEEFVINRDSKQKKDFIVERFEKAKKNLDNWLDKQELADIELVLERQKDSNWKTLIQAQKEVDRCLGFVNKWLKKVKYYKRKYPEKCY